MVSLFSLIIKKLNIRDMRSVHKKFTQGVPKDVGLMTPPEMLIILCKVRLWYEGMSQNCQ